MPINNIVDVQVTRETAGLTRIGFGTMLFVFEATAENVPDNRVTSFSPDNPPPEDFGGSDSAMRAALAYFGSTPRPPVIKIAYRTAEEDWSDSLAAARLADSDFYAFTIDSSQQADIVEASEWALANTVVFIAKTDDEGALSDQSTDDVASVLLSSSMGRTGLIYHADAADAYPDLAWAGGNLTRDPGTYSWNAKTVPGVPGQTFTFAQVAAMESKRVSRVETIQGVTRAFGGFVSESGSFLDDVQAQDWITQRIAESVLDQIVRVPKIPRSSTGIAMVESAITSPLRVAVNRGVIVDDETLKVYVPPMSEIPTIERENRILPDCRFEATLTGAFHSVQIRGTLLI